MTVLSRMAALGRQAASAADDAPSRSSATWPPRCPTASSSWPTAGTRRTPSGELADRAHPHAVRAAPSWARSAGSSPSAATRSSCRAAGARSGPGASSSRCATSRPTGAPRSSGWRPSPGSTAASSCGAASYLGLTQWAVAAGRARLPPGDRLSRSPRRTSATAVVYPGGAFALETALAWLHQIKYQELGWRTVLRTPAARRQGGGDGERRPAPRASATARPSASPCPSTRTGSTHGAPGDPWWDGVDFGRRLDKVPPASFIGGLVRPLPPGAGGRLRGAARAPGGTARLTIGPWTHASPGLFAETVRDGPRWFDAQLGERRGRDAAAPRCASSSWGRARGRSSPCGRRRGRPSGGTSGRWRHAEPDAAGGQRPGPLPLQPARPDAGGGRCRRSTSRTAGRKDQRRREHRRDVLTYTSPVLTEDLTVIGPLTATLYVRSSLEHTDFFVRLCDVSEKGKSFNLSDGIVRLAPGSVDEGRRRRLPARHRHVAHRQHVPGRPPHPPPGLERRPPALQPQRRHRRAAGDGRQPALGRPGGLPRRGAPVVDRAARRAAVAGRARWASVEWVRPTPCELVSRA